MYYHVYGDLYMLSKSNDLGLSVLSMNQHYLELQTYLSEVENSPDIVFDPNYHVFQLQERLYGPDAKVNHYLKLTSLLIKGASKMKEKLSPYAQKQLHWNLDQQIKDVLCQLKPSNDLCESILGLNDYLMTAIPNSNQMARSNLVQAKKNKTLKWLSNLSKLDQLAVVDLAVKKRRQVHKEHKDEEKQRKQNMAQENAKREELKKKLHEEKEKLSQLHLVTTSEELKEELINIDSEKISASKKRNKKTTLLKTQIKIRRKVLCQTVPIVFTTNRKQRPITDIVKELCDFIYKTSFIKDLITLVGKQNKTNL